MKDDKKQQYIEFYSERLEEYGTDPKTLGWRKGRQPVRFRVLSEIGDLHGKQVLDLGCGFGDYYQYLKKYYDDTTYYGVDIQPEFVDIAKRKHPDARFEVLDILEDDPSIIPDYIVASGVFNFKLEGMDEYVNNMLDRMLTLSEEGIAVDFMSSYVDYENEDSYHVDPDDMLRLGKSLTGRVTVRHDYMPYEFALYLYANDNISDRNVFTAQESIATEENA
jgi:SAM-dependent methyltransferase